MTAEDIAHIQDLGRRMQSRNAAEAEAALAAYNSLPGPEFEAVALLRRQHEAAPPAQFVQQFAVGDAAIVCPHCQSRGHAVTRRIKQKRGISGGKATGAILTGGLSMLGTGLSRKETVTEFRCGKCITVWHG